MTTLKQWAYGLALLAAIALLLWGQQQERSAAQANATLASERLATSRAATQAALSISQQLEHALSQERLAYQQLKTQQNALRQSLAARQQHITELTHENQALRDWSAQPLPATAQRLRERPALTGAKAYHNWLSSSGALPTARNPPTQ